MVNKQQTNKQTKTDIRQTTVCSKYAAGVVVVVVAAVIGVVAVVVVLVVVVVVVVSCAFPHP